MGSEGRHRAAAVTTGGSPGEVVAGRSRADRSIVSRPALEARLDEAVSRRLVTLVAGPGSGKSTLLRSWVGRREHAWHTATARDQRLATFVGGLIDALHTALPPDDLGSALGAAASGGSLDETPERVDALAGSLCSLLEATLDRDFLLVIDDLQELGATSASARLVASICRNAPGRLHLVLASRDEMPFPIERLTAYGHVAQLDARDLAFDAPEIGSLLEATGVGVAGGLADDIARGTNGWPAAVRLAVEAIRADPAHSANAIADLQRPGGPLFAYLAAEVFERRSPDVRELIRTVAPLDRFTPELCTALGVANAEATIRWLIARGLFVQRIGEELVLHRLVRDFAARAWPLEAGVTRRILSAASAWHAEQGQTDSAIGLAANAGDWPALGALLVESGSELLRSGGARAVVEAAERLPIEARTPAVARVVGEAYASLGLSGAALEWLERAAPAEGPVPVDVAWRRAMSHYLRDELQEVVRIHDTTDVANARPADVAQLAAWTAGAYRRLGNGEKARELADKALAAAASTGDDAALAVAHTAGSFGAEIAGDRVAGARHLQLALAAAERSGNLLQSVRIRINRGSDLLESGSYVEAIADFDAALEVASLAGYTSLRALALMNRGLAKWCLGRLEAASADYEASIEAYRATGSRELAYAVIGRGDVYRERGDLELARVSYEEGLALAERTGDRQALVPGLYQSAKVIASEDPREAMARAERAVAYGWPDHAWALIALGWVAFMGGDRARARQAAMDAAAAARASKDRFGLSEALELRTWTADIPATEQEGLVQAAGIWRELGNTLREATAELAIARLGTGHGARAAGDAAERRLQRLGVRPSAFGAAGLLTAVARRGRDPVEIRTLGGFRVLRDGEPVALPEWQSRKARDLLKLLIARRGRPVPRDVLIEALWPDEDDGAALGNRLSVAVSLLRLVLDPHKRFDPERFVITDKANVAVDLDSVAIDVESFLAHAAAGFDLERRGRRDDALERLSDAEAAYSGDFLEEHPYDEWAVGLREEARATYLAVANALAEMARDAGDIEREIRFRLRSLERDPFDEASSLALIAAHLRRGSHGEARAAYRRYAQRMEEIDVEAVPFSTDSGAGAA